MLYRNLTGLENLEYFSALAGRPDSTTDELLGFLAKVRLPEGTAEKRVSTYSSASVPLPDGDGNEQPFDAPVRDHGPILPEEGVRSRRVNPCRRPAHRLYQ